jgi:hypothetical protein
MGSRLGGHQEQSTGSVTEPFRPSAFRAKLSSVNHDMQSTPLAPSGELSASSLPLVPWESASAPGAPL